MAFAQLDLDEGCKNGIFEEISASHSIAMRAAGMTVSSCFVLWKKYWYGSYKMRFEINISEQSKNWERGSDKWKLYQQSISD